MDHHHTVPIVYSVAGHRRSHDGGWQGGRKAFFFVLNYFLPDPFTSPPFPYADEAGGRGLVRRYYADR